MNNLQTSIDQNLNMIQSKMQNIELKVQEAAQNGMNGSSGPNKEKETLRLMLVAL